MNRWQEKLRLRPKQKSSSSKRKINLGSAIDRRNQVPDNDVGKLAKLIKAHLESGEDCDGLRGV